MYVCLFVCMYKIQRGRLILAYVAKQIENFLSKHLTNSKSIRV